MKRQIWTPIRADGSLDEAESARPATTVDPTLWEVAVPARYTEPRFLVLHAVAALSLRYPQHTYRVVLPVDFELGLSLFEHCPNVTVAVGPIHTQAEADRALPALLAVKAARREAVFAPTEEIGVSGLAVGIHAVRVRGGETPMHPAWVRLLCAQAVAAGVRFSLSWGDWIPMSEAMPGDERHEHCFAWADPEDKDELPMSCFRAGRTRPCCTLDDRPYPEEP